MYAALVLVLLLPAQQQGSEAANPAERPLTLRVVKEGDETVVDTGKREVALCGKMAVFISGAVVHKAVLQRGRDAVVSDSEYLFLTVGILNQSETRKVDYVSWRVRNRETSLADTLGNRYRQPNFAGAGISVGGVTLTDSKVLYPQEFASDTLLFEIPVAKADTLLLKLPAENFGEKGLVQFRITKNMWDGTLEKEKLAKDAAAKAAFEESLTKAVAERKAANKPREAQKAEQAAAAKLTLIKQLLADGKKDVARERLAELIKKYPATPAAAEAKKLLDGM